MTTSTICESEAPSQYPQYRPAIPVPKEICQHCHIYLDEGLYTSALTLLEDLVVRGASHPNPTVPTFSPLPFHIEIISTLLVHPRYTTQADEHLELTSHSITFLRSLLTILGPLNANLGEAFSLSDHEGRGARRSRNGGAAGSSESDDDETEHIKGIVANKGRLRRSAKDFWHIVGWSFNCSVVYPKRWKYWKVWLDYMLDVLEADWKERAMQEKEDACKSKLSANASNTRGMLKDALLVKYLSEVKGRSSALKRVVGAIFTDGGTDDLRAYPEVFKNETQEITSRNGGQKRKREDEDDFEHGFSAFDDEGVENDTFDSSQPTDEAPSSSQTTDDGEVAADPWLGGPESIALRQRVLAHLSRIAAYLPECFVDVKELYEVFCSNIKQLPLPAFSLLLSPSKSSQLPDVVFVSLSQFLLLRLLPNTAPRPQNVSGRVTDDLDQEILEKCFLPFSAATSAIDDNARVSILVESIFRMFLLEGFTIYRKPSLTAAIEKGIKARESKTKGDRRKRDNRALRKEEERDRVWLRASGERLKSLLAGLE